MGKITWKGGTFIYPLPAVMVSCGDMKNANIITVAWTGIINTNPAMCYISVRPERFSSGIIKKNKEFEFLKDDKVEDYLKKSIKLCLNKWNLLKIMT